MFIKEKGLRGSQCNAVLTLVIGKGEGWKVGEGELSEILACEEGILVPRLPTGGVPLGRWPGSSKSY